IGRSDVRSRGTNHLTSSAMSSLQLLVALGPGDPELIPLAAWRALEMAGPVRLEPDEPLAGWLGEQGIPLAADAPVAAGSGERFVRLAAGAGGVPCVPAGEALHALMA